ncbi:MAG: hypothetical protein PHG54_03670 [Smithellaceae bacterium]|nr:hypothetical protein [Smithellaceae bacterium]
MNPSDKSPADETTALLREKGQKEQELTVKVIGCSGYFINGNKRNSGDFLRKLKEADHVQRQNN